MIIVTGAKGQLGSDVCSHLKRNNIHHLGIDIDILDITDANAVEDFFEEKDFDVIIHCAAYTAVDKAEDEKDICLKVNSTGTENLAKICGKKNKLMIYVSTDYVFDGSGNSPHKASEATSPLNVYGESKLQGEKAVTEYCSDKHFIVRTSWVFGEQNRNFIATMLRLAKTRDTLSVVNDQIGSPTYSKHLAKLLVELTDCKNYGTLHATNEGYCSWYEFAAKAFELKNIHINLKGIPSSEYPTKAQRPLNSRLDKSCLDQIGIKRLPHWEAALKEYLSKAEI